MYKIEIRLNSNNNLFRKKFYESKEQYQKNFSSHQRRYRTSYYVLGFELTNISPLKWTLINGGRTQ